MTRHPLAVGAGKALFRHTRHILLRTQPIAGCRHVVGIVCHRCGEGADGVRRTPLVGEDHAKRIEALRGGPLRHHLADFSLRGGQASLIPIGVGEVVSRLGIVGLLADGGFKRSRGRVQLLEIAQGTAKIRMRLGIERLALDGFAKAVHCVRKAPGCQEQVAEIVVKRCRARRQCDGAAQGSFRLLQPPCRLQGCAEVALRLGEAGSQQERTLDRGDRRRRLTGLQQRDAEQMPGVGVRIIELEALPVQSCRTGRIAGLMTCECLREDGCRLGHRCSSAAGRVTGAACALIW